MSEPFDKACARVQVLEGEKLLQLKLSVDMCRAQAEKAATPAAEYNFLKVSFCLLYYWYIIFNTPNLCTSGRERQS